jgi:DNA gyrase subunit B
LTESGPHIVQIKTVLTREFNKFFRDKGWLKEKDENLTGSDYEEGMLLIFNITAPGVSYDAQVKSRITQIDMRPFTQVLSSDLQAWFNAHEKEAKMIADKAINARKAREAARKAKEAVRTPKDKKNKILNLPTKLVDAWSKDRDKCELFIAEGDSAAAGLIGARDSEFVAVFPVRGKIISAFKNTTEKIFANQEVVNIIKALGLELDPKTKKLIYDKSKLRYGKIMLAADADPDGEAIKNLLLTLFWSLCPELIVNGHVYATIPPLFRITTKKNEYIYLRDAEALEAYKLAHANESFQINRNKGLGEQDPEELAECLLEPATRNVAQITVEDATAADDLFEIFMGSAVPPRREYILKHSEEAEI